MTDVTKGAQRASGQRSMRLVVAVMAAMLAISGLAASPPSAAAVVAPKVVFIVGPMGSMTAGLKDQSDRLAATARSYGATVTRIYSPNATWARVKREAQGAKLLVYMGHGNGWPSPYKPFQPYTKDGLGLNKSAFNGNSNLKYWGEYYLRRDLHLAANAVVILNHLCYASGKSEPGRADPTKSVAKQRVDNYGAGFLRTGARAVFAEAHSSIQYILYGLFKTDQTVSQIFWSGPSTRTYAFGFASSRTAGMRALMDPYRPSKYYRSVIGNLDLTAATWRSD
ncbi:MAG: hypothetical protein ABWY52_08435 [Candidatus Limnocylindrales bacterium]